METPLNMGPQHPSMHGVLHLRTVVDGEIVKSVDPDVGLIHRGLEKIAENRMYFKFTPVANKIDYIAAASWEHCYISAVEQLIGMQIPEQSAPPAVGSQLSPGSSTHSNPSGHGRPAIPPHRPPGEEICAEPRGDEVSAKIAPVRLASAARLE